MTSNADFFKTAATWAQRFALGALARDDLHLGPEYITKAAARRLLQAMAVIEAYLRRLIFLLALELEHDLKPDTAPRIKYARVRTKTSPKPTFRVWPGCWTAPSEFNTFERGERVKKWSPPKVKLAPLMKRFHALCTILDNPTARPNALPIACRENIPGHCFHRASGMKCAGVMAQKSRRLTHCSAIKSGSKAARGPHPSAQFYGPDPVFACSKAQVYDLRQ